MKNFGYLYISLLCTQNYGLWRSSQQISSESYAADQPGLSVPQCLDLPRTLLADPPCNHLSLVEKPACKHLKMTSLNFAWEILFFSDPTGFLYSCPSCKLQRSVYSHVAGEIPRNGLLSPLHLPRQNKHSGARCEGKKIWLLNSKTLLFYILLKGPAAVMLQTADQLMRLSVIAKSWFSTHSQFYGLYAINAHPNFQHRFPGYMTTIYKWNR